MKGDAFVSNPQWRQYPKSLSKKQNICPHRKVGSINSPCGTDSNKRPCAILYGVWVWCLHQDWLVCGRSQRPLARFKPQSQLSPYQPVRSLWAHSHWVTLSQHRVVEQTNRSSTSMSVPLVQRDLPFVFYFILKRGFIRKWIKGNSLNNA